MNPLARAALAHLVAQSAPAPTVRWERPPEGTLRRGALALYSSPRLWAALTLVAAAALVVLAVRARLRRR